MVHVSKAVTQKRREKVWSYLTRGMKGYEIARELNVEPSTISRDIHYLTTESQNYIAKLAKETLPFMYQTAIEGINSILRESWRIYEQCEDDSIRISALKLAKDSHESIFHLTSEGPFIMSVKALEDRLILLEDKRISQ